MTELDVADDLTGDTEPSAQAAESPPIPATPVAGSLPGSLATPLAGPWQPLTSADPCGPDLDLDGDNDYLNFLAHTEGILPGTFFSLEDKRPFDRTSIDLPGRLAALAPLLQRTRDLRLMVLQARLSILDKDLASFSVTLSAIAAWLEQFWDAVHPRAEGGSLTMREMALAELDGPMVTFPLQYAPLFDTRRLGTISYRSWMIAEVEAAPRPGETKLAPAAIVEARADADAAAVETARNSIFLIKNAVNQIRNAFAMQGAAPGLDNIAKLIEKMALFIDPGGQHEAATVAAPEIDLVDAGTQPGLQAHALTAQSATSSAPTTLAQARDALAQIARYYSQSEPSSPILPLVLQAHQLIGKSFYEVLTILVPTQMDKAAFQIGTEQVFELPLGKLSGLTTMPPARTMDDAGFTELSASVVAAPNFQVGNRAQAIALLDQVQRFFRYSEPSSPVPMICDRARAMAERDFMSVLRDVLPKAALKNSAADK